MNAKASKYLTPKGKEIIEAAKAFVKEHPAGSGYKYKKKHSIASKQEVISMALHKAIVSIKNIVQTILIMDKFIKKKVQDFLNR